MTNNPSTNEVICWNCYKKTPPPVCIHCGARLKLITQPIEEKNSISEVSPKKIYYEIPGMDIRINLNILFDIIKQHFEIISLPTPTKLVMRVRPLETSQNLDEVLSKIKKEVAKIAPGLYPFLTQDTYHKESMLLSFQYIPVLPTFKWLKIINYLFIILSSLIPAYGWLYLHGNSKLTTISQMPKTVLLEATLVAGLFLIGYSIHLFLGSYFQKINYQEKQSNIVVPSIPSLPVGAIAWLNESLEPPYNKEKQITVELTKWFSHLVYAVILLIFGLIIPWNSPQISSNIVSTRLNASFDFLFRIFGFYDHSSPVYFAGITYMLFILIQGLPLGNLLGGRIFYVLTSKKVQQILLAVVIFLLLNLDLTIGIFSLFIFFFSRKIPPMDTYSRINTKQRLLGFFPIVLSLLILSITVFHELIRI